MIAVDTNIICLRWLPAAENIWAESLLQHDPHWIAPLLWRSEFRNVLAGFIRRGALSMAAALIVVERAESNMKGCEFSVKSEAVLGLIAHSKCSAYDCEFVALAQDQKVRLVTSDRKVLRHFPTVASSIRDFLSTSQPA